MTWFLPVIAAMSGRRNFLQIMAEVPLRIGREGWYPNSAWAAVRGARMASPTNYVTVNGLPLPEDSIPLRVTVGPEAYGYRDETGWHHFRRDSPDQPWIERQP